MVFTIGQTDADMKGIGRTTKRKVMVFCIGLTVANGKVIGKKVTEVGKVIILTRMGLKLNRIIIE